MIFIIIKEKDKSINIWWKWIFFKNHVTHDKRIYDLNLKLLLQSLGVGQFQESWLKKNIQMAKFTDLKTKKKKRKKTEMVERSVVARG